MAQVAKVSDQWKPSEQYPVPRQLVTGQSIHHTSLSIGTDAVIQPVFGTSVKVTVFNGFHTVTIFMDCAALEKIFQAWQAFDPIPF